MDKICMVVLGLKATGKTTFCNFLKENYSATILYLRKMLEEKILNLKNKNEIYFDLQIKQPNKIALMNYLKNEIESYINNSHFIVIEGMISETDIEWFNQTFGMQCIKVCIKNSNDNLRFRRYVKRNNYSEDFAKDKMTKSDSFRSSITNINDFDFIIKNDSSLLDFEKKIDFIMSKILFINPKVSVLIPVYNTQKYLAKCIGSVIGQTYKNIEIIVVDDGSTDGSSKICDYYSSIDSRIKLFHNEHKGLVSTRKIAIQQATGDYCLCVDSDDYVDANMIEKMLFSAIKNNADVVCVGYTKEKNSGTFPRQNFIKSGIYKDKKLKSFYSTMIYSGIFYRPGIIPFICCKLIKRDLYERFQLAVPSQISRGEDVAVIFPMLADAKVIVVDNSFAPYHYRENHESICHTLNLELFEKNKILFDYLDCSLKQETLIKQIPYYKLFALKTGIEKYIFESTASKVEKNTFLKQKMSLFDICEIIENIDLKKNNENSILLTSLTNDDFSALI